MVQMHNAQATVYSVHKLIQLVLENNHFPFNKENYIQKIGTAMGSPMAPAYASLFMGKHKQEFLESRDLVPSVWLRFFDDIFMVRDHSLGSLHIFYRCAQLFSS